MIDLAKLKVEWDKMNQTMDNEPFTNSLMSETRKYIIRLNCMIQAIFQFLPTDDQETIFQDYSKLLSERNLKIVY